MAQTYRGYSRTPDPGTRDTEPRLVILGHQPPESLATQTLTTQDPDANLFLHFFVKKKKKDPLQYQSGACFSAMIS